MNFDWSVAIIKKIQTFENQKIVFTNGAFDCFHVGHLRYLLAAKKDSEKLFPNHKVTLVVGVNSDASVKMSKGQNRPIISAEERAEIVFGVKGVDYVFIFNEKSPIKLMQVLRPDIQAKGTDYTPDTVPEKSLLEEWGGQVIICGDPKNHSTTETVKKLQDLAK